MADRTDTQFRLQLGNIASDIGASLMRQADETADLKELSRRLTCAMILLTPASEGFEYKVTAVPLAG